MSYTNVSGTETIWSLFGLIVLCALGTQASTLPPDPNNAALLYYQAFLHQPETDYAEEQLVYNTRAEKIYDFLCGGKLEFDTDIEEDIQELENRLKNDVNEPDEMPFEFEGIEIPPELRVMMTEGAFGYDIQHRLSELRKRREHEQKMRGIDPNETIRNYMKECRDAIELAEAASKLTDCDWGIRYSRPDGPTVTPLAKIRRFAFMLRVDALLHAANGDCRMAFERCLMIRRFARHLGNDTNLLYIMSTSIGRMALYDIQILLGYHKPEVETLTWLENQLAIEKDKPLSLAKVLKTDFELALQGLLNSAEMLDNAHHAMRLKDEISASFKSKQPLSDRDAGEVRSITDEELVALAGQPYADFLNSALQVIDGGRSYQEKLSEIKSLTEKIENEFGGDPASFPILAAHPEKMLTFSIVICCADTVSGVYRLHIDHIARYNILMTGMEVYLIRAQTGQLPAKLPEDVPKDPFTGRDFKYEITEDGFTLLLPDKNVPGADKRVPRQKSRAYEFKVKK